MSCKSLLKQRPCYQSQSTIRSQCCTLPALPSQHPLLDFRSAYSAFAITFAITLHSKFQGSPLTCQSVQRPPNQVQRTQMIKRQCNISEVDQAREPNLCDLPCFSVQVIQCTCTNTLDWWDLDTWLPCLRQLQPTNKVRVSSAVFSFYLFSFY